MAKNKNPHAVALGRIGGKAKVKKGFAMLSAEGLAELVASREAKRAKKNNSRKTR